MPASAVPAPPAAPAVPDALGQVQASFGWRLTDTFGLVAVGVLGALLGVAVARADGYLALGLVLLACGAAVGCLGVAGFRRRVDVHERGLKSRGLTAAADRSIPFAEMSGTRYRQTTWTDRVTVTLRGGRDVPLAMVRRSASLYDLLGVRMAGVPAGAAPLGEAMRSPPPEGFGRVMAVYGAGQRAGVILCYVVAACTAVVLLVGVVRAHDLADYLYDAKWYLIVPPGLTLLAWRQSRFRLVVSERGTHFRVPWGGSSWACPHAHVAAVQLISSDAGAGLQLILRDGSKRSTGNLSNAEDAVRKISALVAGAAGR
ncbi:MAG TPA: hypothetical protein VF796_25510 [Humisphaera sp.]